MEDEYMVNRGLDSNFPSRLYGSVVAGQMCNGFSCKANLKGPVR